MQLAAAVCMYADELVIENLRPETQYHFFVMRLLYACMQMSW